MAIEAIKASTFAFASEGQAASSQQKKDLIFDGLLSVFQAEITGNLRNIPVKFNEKFSADSASRKIQDLAAPVHQDSMETVKKEPGNRLQSDNQNKTESATFEKKVESLTRSNLTEAIYNLFGNSPAAGLVDKPVFGQVSQLSLADEINYLMDQLVQQIKVAKVDGLARMDLLLNGEKLGNIKISLSFENNKLNIEMFVSPEVRALLEPHFAGLIEKLEQSGIGVGGLNVTLKENNRNDYFWSDQQDTASDKQSLNYENKASQNAVKFTQLSSFLKTWAFWRPAFSTVGSRVETLV